MVDVPTTDEETETKMKTITEGYFEEELNIDADSVGAFLIELGHQFQEGDQVTIQGDGWELPFSFREPIELEIEFEGDGEPELEIEIELKGGSNDEAPTLG